MASQSLIDELTASCADVDLGRRATILARLTNLFISGRAAYDERQIALFDNVLIRLSEQVESVARARLWERLAAISDPPGWYNQDLGEGPQSSRGIAGPDRLRA